MSVPCRWYALVLLTCTLWPGLAGFADEEAQIERPKELLRHQQNHRPSFIDHKLVDRLDVHEITETPIDEDDLEADDQLTGRSKLETNIEKPATQIRHSRSRSHFVRQAKLDEPDIVYVSGGSSKKTQQMDDESQTESISGLEKSRGKSLGSTGISGQDLRLSGTIDERSTVDLDKLLTRLSEAGSDRRKEGKMSHKGDSFNKLKKVIIGNRSRVFGNRTAGNLSEVYGHVIHGESTGDRNGLNDVEIIILEDYDVYDNDGVRNSSERGDYDEYGKNGDQGKPNKEPVHVDIVTRFLRIIENQHLLGKNCTAGTDLSLGEGIVDQYTQERFRLAANLAVNSANMLTRLWKYAPEVMLSSEYLLHANILSMVEFDEDIFAAGNCYDKLQYRDRWLYCPFAHRLQEEEGILAKDLAVEYKYLSNSSEWFYIARKNAERVIANNDQYSRGELLAVASIFVSLHIILLSHVP